MKSPTWRACRATLFACAAGAAGLAALAHAADWPTWGGTPSRNMVSAETGLPTALVYATPPTSTEPPDPTTAKNLKWVAALGTETYGNPTVGGGRVFVGTNNGKPRDPKYKDDYGILLCLDEKDGHLVWQLAVPKLAGGREIDNPTSGICSSPAVDGDRVYTVTNRGEVLCLDVNGQADGNAGPFTDEAQYTAGPGQPPIPQGPTDADIVWRFDLRHQLGVVPRHMTSSSVLIVGDRLYVNTSNGTDWTAKHVPAPNAPALICLDKKTGKLLGVERSGISARTLYGNYSSPSFGTVAGKPTVVFGGGDGFCYGFDPDPGTPGADGAGTLNELWRVDCNPPATRAPSPDGRPRKPGDEGGPSAIIASPVVADGRVYVGVGWISEADVGHAPGCFNAIGAGPGGKVVGLWQYTKIIQTMSTASVGNGLVFVADAAGIVHCLDPQTGAAVWTHDTESQVMGSTLLADGKLYVAGGDLTVLAASKEKKILGKLDFGSGLECTPVAANGVLYITMKSQLFAVK